MSTDKSTGLAAPLISPENKAFWDAANQNLLMIKRCRDCTRMHWHPRALCPWCFSANTEWLQTSGKGVIYSYTLIAGETNSAPAYVRLEEGLTLLTQVRDSAMDQLRIGAAVSVFFAETEAGQSIPVFKLTAP